MKKDLIIRLIGMMIDPLSSGFWDGCLWDWSLGFRDVGGWVIFL